MVLHEYRLSRAGTIRIPLISGLKKPYSVVAGGAGNNGPAPRQAGFMGCREGFENRDIGKARQAGISPLRADLWDLRRCEGGVLSGVEVCFGADA